MHTDISCKRLREQSEPAAPRESLKADPVLFLPLISSHQTAKRTSSILRWRRSNTPPPRASKEGPAAVEPPAGSAGTIRSPDWGGGGQDETTAALGGWFSFWGLRPPRRDHTTWLPGQRGHVQGQKDFLLKFGLKLGGWGCHMQKLLCTERVPEDQRPDPRSGSLPVPSDRSA